MCWDTCLIIMINISMMDGVPVWCYCLGNGMVAHREQTVGTRVTHRWGVCDGPWGSPSITPLVGATMQGSTQHTTAAQPNETTVAVAEVLTCELRFCFPFNSFPCENRNDF